MPLVIALAIGGAIGLRLALKVEMTQMPELVAILHSFVGLAAVLVGYNSFFETHSAAGAALTVHLTEVFLGVFIGAVTFSGSIVAFAKLRGIASSKPLNIPHKHKLNLLALIRISSVAGLFCRLRGGLKQPC